MKYRILGGTGISVSELSLGSMMFGSWGNADHDEVVKIIHAALDAGVNLIDSADVYSKGESEVIIGKALKGRREGVVVATKFYNAMSKDRNHRGGSARWIKQAVEGSLRRLGVEYIDLYQMHRPDPDTDIEETLSALTDLVRAGKVRAIGSSTFPAEQIVEAQWASERRGHHFFRSEQPPYSMLTRGIEAAVLPTARKYNQGIIVWGPLSSGWLSGKKDLTATARAKFAAQKFHFDLSTPENQAKLRAVDALSSLAHEAGIPLPHLALAFARAHPAVTSVLVGARTMEQLNSSLDGAVIELDDSMLDRIDEIVPPGTDLNPAETHFSAPALKLKELRRRQR